MKLLASLNPEHADAQTIAGMTRREGARGVIFDSKGRICLMHATKPGYHKLPGGGIEDGETPQNAFVRECLEETGFAVEVTEMMGRIEEYRTDINRHQTSYCLTGRAIERLAEPTLEQGEIKLGFRPEWFLPEAALETMRDQPARSKRIIVQRDLLILQAALN